MGANQLKADACPLQPERRVLSWQMHHLFSASIVGVPRLQCFQLLYQVHVVCGLRLQYELLGGDASVDNRQAPSSFAQPLRPLSSSPRAISRMRMSNPRGRRPPLHCKRSTSFQRLLLLNLGSLSESRIRSIHWQP